MSLAVCYFWRTRTWKQMKAVMIRKHLLLLLCILQKVHFSWWCNKSPSAVFEEGSCGVSGAKGVCFIWPHEWDQESKVSSNETGAGWWQIGRLTMYVDGEMGRDTGGITRELWRLLGQSILFWRLIKTSVSSRLGVNYSQEDFPYLVLYSVTNPWFFSWKCSEFWLHLSPNFGHNPLIVDPKLNHKALPGKR